MEQSSKNGHRVLLKAEDIIQQNGVNGNGHTYNGNGNHNGNGVRIEESQKESNDQIPFIQEDVVPKKKKGGRRKIDIEYIPDKNRRHITFSKRKGGLMKKAYELSTLTGTQMIVICASETGHVYTFATPKLQPLITRQEGKTLIQECLATTEEDEKQLLTMQQVIQNQIQYPQDQESLSLYPQYYQGYPPRNYGSQIPVSPNGYQMQNVPYQQTQYEPEQKDDGHEADGEESESE